MLNVRFPTFLLSYFPLSHLVGLTFRTLQNGFRWLQKSFRRLQNDFRTFLNGIRNSICFTPIFKKHADYFG